MPPISVSAAVTAWTDLIAVLLILPMLLHISRLSTEKFREKACWLRFFALMSAGCFWGFLAHYFCRTELSYRLVWIPLYAVLFPTVNCFLLLAKTMSGREPGRALRRGLWLAALMVYLPTVLIWVITGVGTIRIFSVYAAAVGLWGFGIVLKLALREKHPGARYLLSALLPLLPAVYVQLRRSVELRLIWTFDCNGITHLLLIVSLFILWAAACISLRKPATDS